MQGSDTTTNLSRLLGIDHEQVRRVLGCGSEVSYVRGEFVFREGEEADTFYVVTQGVVALQVYVPGRGAHTISTVQADEVLGWSWLFPPYRWHFDAEVLEPTVALAFDARCLRAACEADHDLGYPLVWRFAEIITQRLQATRLQLLDMYKVEGGS